METKGFKKLSTKAKEQEYGGWAWLATAAPIFLQAVMTAVSSYKMIVSDKGSVKYDGADAHWEKSKSKGSTHTAAAPKHVFYAF